MSLMQLLTTGTSFSGLKDSEPRYRVTHARLLPQFGPAKNPFATTDNVDNPDAELRGKRELSPVSSPPVGAKAPAAPARGLATALGVMAANGPTLRLRSDSPAATNNCRSGAAASFAKLAARLGALFSRPAAKPAKVTLPGPAKAHVQGELALDRIKVVRNDLSDADLEVVPARPPITKVKTAPASRIPEGPTVCGMTPGRMAGVIDTAKS